MARYIKMHRPARIWPAAIVGAAVLSGCEFTSEPLLSFLRQDEAAEAMAAEDGAAPEALAAVAPAAGDAARPPERGMAARPLIVIRFDNPDTEFDDALGGAVEAALITYPLSIFEVQALAPDAMPLDAKAAAMRDARDSAERVMRSLAAHGVPASQVQLSARTDAGVSTPQVSVFIR